MGQAKQRGTYEQRQRAAIERDVVARMKADISDREERELLRAAVGVRRTNAPRVGSRSTGLLVAAALMAMAGSSNAN